MTPEQKRDRDTLRKAIAEAVTQGARNRTALNRVLNTTRTGEPPTAVQLRMVNYTRARLGLPRVSLPVFDREKRRAFYERRSQTINSEHATLVASRPLSPPMMTGKSCVCSDYMSGGIPCPPGCCPNA